jgi:hypothetical protein
MSYSSLLPPQSPPGSCFRCLRVWSKVHGVYLNLSAGRFEIGNHTFIIRFYGYERWVEHAETVTALERERAVFADVARAGPAYQAFERLTERGLERQPLADWWRLGPGIEVFLPPAWWISSSASSNRTSVATIDWRLFFWGFLSVLHHKMEINPIGRPCSCDPAGTKSDTPDTRLQYALLRVRPGTWSTGRVVHARVV